MRYLALHGFTGDGADFSALSLFVGGEWQCPDLPGHGRRGDAPEEEFSLERLAERLLRGEKTEAPDPAPQHPRPRGPQGTPAGSAPLTGLGYSLGGRLLLHLALLRPDTFSRLILIGASPGPRTSEERIARIESDAEWIRNLRSGPLDNFLEAWWDQPVLAGLKELSKPDREELRQRRLDNNPTGLALSLQHHGNGTLPALWHRLNEITVPVLLCVGENDRKFQRIAQEMAALLPNATTVMVPRSGHSPHLENPKGLAAGVFS